MPIPRVVCAIILRMDAMDRQILALLAGGWPAHLRRHRRAGAAFGAVGEAASRPAAGLRGRSRGSPRWSITARSAGTPRRWSSSTSRPGRARRGRRGRCASTRRWSRPGASPARPTRSRGCEPQDNHDLERLIIDLQRNGLVVRTRSQVVLSRLVSRPAQDEAGGDRIRTCEGRARRLQSPPVDRFGTPPSGSGSRRRAECGKVSETCPRQGQSPSSPCAAVGAVLVGSGSC